MSGPLDFPDDEPAGGEREEPRREAARAHRARPERARFGPGRFGPGRFGWVAGVLVLAAIALLMLHGLRRDSGTMPGLRAGARMPPFAVPLALSDLDGDANVATRAHQGAAGARPACQVRGPRILNSCELAARGPVVLAFLATRGGDCSPQLDRLEQLRRRFRRVQVAAVAIRGDRGALRALIRRHGWRFPVGYDRDGALAGLYGVAVCPQITYAYPGGVVRDTVLGEETAPQLAERFRGLLAASRERGWS